MLKSRLPQIAARMHSRAERALALTAREIAQDAEANVARDTGETAAGIKAEPVGTLHWRVTAPFPAGLIEFGTRKMPARPFMVPAAERARRQALRRLKRSLF